MAFVTEYTCSRAGCGNVHYGLVRKDRLCPACVEIDHKAALRTRRVHLAGLTGLTVEERLAQIEARLYDLDAEARLAALEVRDATY